MAKFRHNAKHERENAEYFLIQIHALIVLSTSVATLVRPANTNLKKKYATVSNEVAKDVLPLYQ